MRNNCRQCGEKFEIDEAFFGKIKIPAPTLCPDCRQIRRMIFRNDRSFYNRKCNTSSKQFVSMYASDAPYKIYHPDEWYSDKWNPFDFGRNFDFKRPFFEQFAELMKDVPRLGIDIVNCQNSYYCNFCGDDKNCYLDIAGEANEDSYFNLFVKYSKNVVDCTFVYNSELCYECINCYDCYACQNSIYLENCNDCLFCYDLKGCQNCLFSSGLRNKQYYIFNQKKTKKEYEEYVSHLLLNSYSQRKKLYDGWIKYKTANAINRSNQFLNCENVSGDNLKNCKNTFHSYNATNCEDCAYLYDVLDATDCQDLNYSLYKPQLSYELISTLSMVKSAFSMSSHYNNEIFYCDLTNNSSYLFGCIGLNHGQYCILNKKYTRDEYESLLPKIIGHMQKTGEWGEFFPASISPFAYNEVVASEYYPLKKKEALKKGFKWRDDDRENLYKGPKYQIPDKIEEVSPDLPRQVLLCETTGKPYRIVESELKFYKKMNIPIPRLCPDQRHLERVALRNPRHLWNRNCSLCDALLEVTYRPECTEKIYCEQCYQKGIY